MAGLLDPSTLQPDFLDPSGGGLLSSPEYRRQRLFDTLGGIGAALLQAGSQGADLGTSLAAGLAGGAQAGRGGEDRFLRRAMVGSQVAKNRQEMANEKAWRDMFKTPIASSAAVSPQLGSATAPAQPAPQQAWAPTPQAKEMVDYFVTQHGFNPVQAAVAVGNFQQESGLNPTAVHDGGTGYGVAGWRLDRRDALNNYAKLKGGNVADPKLQADFFVDELKTRPEWQAFSQAQDPRTAGAALMNYFRPAGWTPNNPTAGHGFDNRVQFAQALVPGGAPVAQGDAAPSGLTHDGLPLRRNADGSHSSELSITVTNPRLNGGQPTNIPSLWGGRELDEEAAVAAALQSGRQFQAFPTIDAAVAAARARSNAGGANAPPAVQPAQYQPQQPPQQAFRPQTIQDVVQTIPPGVRQMIGAMGRKEGMGVLMKYADPGSEAVLDTQTNQIVFIPKTMVGRDPRYVPAKVAELDIQRQQLANSQRKTDIDERNAPVTIGNDGRPIPNQQVIDAEAAKAGAKVGPEVTTELAKDGIKRNSEWQTSALKAQSSIGRLGALNSLLDQVTTGRFKGTTTDIKAAAKGAGIDLEAMGIKDDVAPAQAITALTNLMALENRDPSTGAGMPGAMSDADRAYLQQATISITKDPAGNKILIAIKKGDLQRQVDVAKYAREYLKSQAFKDNPAGLDDYIAEKIAGKDYYDKSALQPQKSATDDYLKNLPPPPSGFSVPGQGQSAPSGVPAPPSGFRIVK